MSDHDDDRPDFALTAEFASPPTVAPNGQRITSRAASRRRSELTRQAFMRRRFGPGPAGATCGQCVFLVASRGHRRYWYKCQKYRITGCEATDWRRKWTACGAFEPSPDREPVPPVRPPTT
jgi:hypothetical protein